MVDPNPMTTLPRTSAKAHPWSRPPKPPTPATSSAVVRELPGPLVRAQAGSTGGTLGTGSEKDKPQVGSALGFTRALSSGLREVSPDLAPGAARGSGELGLRVAERGGPQREWLRGPGPTC